MSTSYIMYEFQLSMLSSSIISLCRAIFLEEVSFPQEPPNLVQLIVSQTTSYIMGFNLLCWVIDSLYIHVKLHVLRIYSTFGDSVRLGSLVAAM